MKRIAIFASGSGTNAENIIHYFRKKGKAEIALVLCNNKKAGVIERCRNLGVECVIFDRRQFYETDEVLDILARAKIDWIVLAGFLWLIPQKMIQQYHRRIINIHPALLPQHGGKGFYGEAVHKSVLQSKAEKSGITIHYVNEHFDKGEIIFQAECVVTDNDNPDSLAAKVHILEYEHYPKVIEQLIRERQTTND